MKHTYKNTLHACYTGYITQAIVNNLAPVLFIVFQTEFQLSFEMIGRLILINFCTQIFADILAVKFVDRMGYRTAGMLAHALSAIGLISLGVLPKVCPNPYVGLVIAVMIYAMGGGILEVIVSPIVESLPGEEKEAAMSLLHSFYCWGQVGVVLITTVCLSVIGTKLWFVLPIFWASIPLFNLVRFMKVPLRPIVEEGTQIPIKELLRSKFFWLALVFMVCAGASELTMSQWSSLFAEKGLQVPKVMGDLLGPCLFAVAMGLTRTWYGIYGSKIDIRKALLGSGVLCVICYGITIFARNPIISLLGCASCGFTVALMWPGTFSLSAKYFPGGGTALFGLLAIAGDVGAAIGPWLAGAVSDTAQKSRGLVEWAQLNLYNIEQIGFKLGLLLGILFPFVLVCGAIVFIRQKEENNA